MTTYYIAGSGQKIDLNKNHFVAQGGEGSIYIKGNTAYKICVPGHMVPEGKLRELAVFTNPHIIKPKEIILDANKNPTGYTMDVVPNDPFPLAQILTKTYRQRENITNEMMMKLIAQIREYMEHIHSKNCLQVDANELNYMVTKDHKEAYVIDVNSFETPHYPADAIMDSIRDWSVKGDNSGRHHWTEMSDWYSFAIISFQMFSGIHPYKGFHKNYPNKHTAMVDQMKNHISVLSPDVTFPKGAVYFPFKDYIPEGWLKWYQAVLQEGKRVPPPHDFFGVVKLVPVVKQIAGSNNFVIEELQVLAEPIIGYYQCGYSEVFALQSGDLVYNSRLIAKPNGRVRVGFTPIQRLPIVAWIDSAKQVHLKNLSDNMDLSVNLTADDMMVSDNRLYFKSGGKIIELVLSEMGGKILTLPNVVANIAELSSVMFQGVVIQNLFNATIVSMFPRSKEHRQILIKELADYKIIDAKSERNVLMLIGVHKKTGKYDRLIFRFSDDWLEYDTRVIADISNTGLNFTVMENGVVICMTEEEKIELFSSKKDSVSIKEIDDPVLSGDMHLCHSGSQVQFAQGNKFYKIKVKN